MTLFTTLYQDLFFRALDAARGRRTIERLHFLRKSQHWDRATLQRWQLERLNALLLQARDHSPYYAKALADVKLPLQSLDQLCGLPILDKPSLRQSFETLQCRNLPRSRFVPAGPRPGSCCFRSSSRRGTPST